MTGYITLLIASCVLSAIFVAGEKAYASANSVRLENLSEDGSRAARYAFWLCENFNERTLWAVTLCTVFAKTTAAAMAALIAYECGGGWYIVLAAAAAVIVLQVFVEAAPRSIAEKHSNRAAMLLSPLVRFVTLLLTPIIVFVRVLSRLFPKRESADEDEGEEEAAIEELQSIIETAEDEDVIDIERSELLRSALDFSEISASEVMTSRVDMLALDIDDDWEEIVETLENSPYSRLPVYEDSIDNIIGILSLNHFYKAATEQKRPDIRKLLIEPCYVYKTVKLPEVLSHMRKAKLHMVIVTDEYGGSMGVITMEDVLEQLVGEIWDETDEVVSEVTRRGDGDLELDGDMIMSDFLELVGKDEDSIETESATVGGWTIEMFGTFPEVGQSFEFENLNVTVLAMDGRRVERVLVHIS